MLLKSADDKGDQLAVLENLLARAPQSHRARIKQELHAMRAGIKGEKEAAYLIDFELKKAKNTVVIHDLRLEIGGRVAQIDHLLIRRDLTVYVLETKNFLSGVKITEDGEFLRWNDFKKTFEGMASPLAQNERHISVLKDAFDEIGMPIRLGIRLTPTFEPFVLVSLAARIDRPRKFDSSRVIKADMLLETLLKGIDNESILRTVTSMAKFVSAETVADIGKELIALHRAATFDYAAKFGLSDMASYNHAVNEPASEYKARPTKPARTQPSCKNCGDGRLSIQYGKFGYYFKCADCGNNMPIKLGCGNDNHRERIRKDGHRFFRECGQCGTSSLYFLNPE